MFYEFASRIGYPPNFQLFAEWETLTNFFSFKSVSFREFLELFLMALF